MSYKLKKDHLIDWDAHEYNDKSIFNDDQDSYISERPSTGSLDDNNFLSNSNNKQLPISPNKPNKQPHNLRYHYNELPENGIPLAIQVDNAKKEEEKIKKNIRKAPPGKGSLVPLPETQPPEIGDNYYPYWYYYKAKNPDWIMRHRQTTNGQLIPYESVDPSQYVHQPALTTSEIKPSRRHQKSYYQDSSNMPYNRDKQGYEFTQKVTPSSHENSEQQRSSSKQNIPLKNADNYEHSDPLNQQTKSHQRSKLKTENDWTEHYVRSITGKSSQSLNNQAIIADTPTHRSKHRSKNMNNNSSNENGKRHHSHRHHRHHHHHHHRHSLPQSQPSQSPHHHHSPPPQQEQQQHLASPRSQQPHHHHHHHLYPPFKEYVDTEFQVIDASFKKSERTPYFQQKLEPLHSPPPAIYNQDFYLPPIKRGYSPKPILTDYHSTQNLSQDWRNSIKSPKIYKADSKPNFYDRYLNSVIDKRLTT